MDTWIKLEDKYPPINEKVLVCIGNYLDKIYIMEYEGICTYKVTYARNGELIDGEESEHRWRTQDGGIWHGSRGFVAWMPLPKPPN